MREREDHTWRCIPLKIHGDGTPVTGLGKQWGRLVDIFSSCSLLVDAPTILRLRMLCVFSISFFSCLGGWAFALGLEHHSLSKGIFCCGWSTNASRATRHPPHVERILQKSRLEFQRSVVRRAATERLDGQKDPWS